MKNKNTYNVNVVLKDGSRIDHSVAIEVEAWGIGWISHEVEKALNVNLPIDGEITKIEKISEIDFELEPICSECGCRH